MAHRYARVDVAFPHKRTANALHDKFGPAGPLTFLYLILAAKDGSPPGSFSYPNEAIGWQKLGLDGRDMPFTLDEFFTTLGRLKQSSRRRNGRVLHAYLTRYGDWQKDARRYEEATRKASKREESTADTKRTQRGTRSGHNTGPSSRTRTTPKPPSKRTPKPLTCPRCGINGLTPASLPEHLEIVHGVLPEAAA